MLADMPARIAEIARAAQAANDALRSHLDEMARQRYAKERSPRDEAYEALALALLERVRELRGDAKQLAIVLERSTWHLALLRSGELDGEPAPQELDGETVTPAVPEQTESG
jgi:hypothetical protein